jgi:hypothetical protein
MRDLAILEKRTGSAHDGLGHSELISPQTVASDDAPFVLDLPHANKDARNLFGRTMPIVVDALAWLPTGEALPISWSEAYFERFRLNVRGHAAWCPPANESADAPDVVKQVSFLHASAGPDEKIFRDHYRRHVELARRHMPALWQYIQNDVEAAEGDAHQAVGVVAVSELWFRTTDDFLNRYFPSEVDRQAFSAQEGFLDLTQATSFICSSHRLLPSEDHR